MDDFLKQHARKTWLIGIVIAILISFIGMKYAVGLLAGLAFGEIHRRLSAYYLGNVLFFREYKPLGAYLFFAFGIALLCVPILLGGLYPERINIFTAAFGVMLFRYEIFFNEVVKGRKEG